MKILLVCNKSPWPPKDGGALATLSLAQSLAKNKVDVTLLFMNTSKHPQKIADIPEEIKQDIRFHAVDVRTKPKFLPALLDIFLCGKPYIAKRFYSRVFLQKLQDLLKKETFDVIQFEGLYTYQYIADIRRCSNALLAYRPHNLEHEIWKGLSGNAQNILKKFYFSLMGKKLLRLEKSLLNQYDCLIPISSTDLEGFYKMGNTKPAHIAPFGIFPGQTVRKDKEKEPAGLFFIGALDWLPNQEGLMWFCRNVWPGLKNKYPQLVFKLAGRNAPEKFVRKLKKHQIVFEGEIEQAKDFMQNSGIMIVPLLSGSGMRVKIIEGMSLGIPIIATSVAAKGIPVKNEENILLADTNRDFTLAVEKLISDPTFRKNVSDQAFLFASHNFNNFDIAARLIDFFKNSC
jgi:polysaccharide biosynthesis protein PslH